MTDPARLIAGLNEWVLREARPIEELPQFVDRLARWLCDAGLPLSRISTGFHARHPELRILAVRWEPNDGARLWSITHEEYSQEQDRTPFEELWNLVVPEVRCRLLDGTPTGYPIVERLRGDGGTDYIALRLLQDCRISYTTNAPDGFSDDHLAVLRGTTPIIGLQIDRASRQHALHTLLDVYLGHDAAQRVRDGQVQRGTGIDQRCALWFCDMRGFTELSDRQPRRDVVALLDEVFERVGGAIADHGGEVLKFIGDAVLATFSIIDMEHPGDAARRALEAARAALAALDTWNAEHPDRTVGIGVALHIGDVLYGNVGARDRLDFTVIGAAVNEVCRIEALCKPTGVRLLCSEEFASAVGHDALTELGQFPLKGVARLVRVYRGESSARRSSGY